MEPTLPLKQTRVSLQDTFLSRLVDAQNWLHIYLINGIKLQGYLEGFDQQVLLLRAQLKDEPGLLIQVIYKRAISTVLYFAKPAASIKSSMPIMTTEEKQHEQPGE